MLWFTMNQVFEPSIPPYINGVRELPDDLFQAVVLEHFVMEAGGSWVRFGYPAHLLFPVGLNYRTPRLPRWRGIINDWRVSYKAIAVTDCLAIDRADDALEWERIWTQPVPQLPSMKWPPITRGINVFSTPKGAPRATSHS